MFAKLNASVIRANHHQLVHTILLDHVKEAHKVELTTAISSSACKYFTFHESIISDNIVLAGVIGYAE